MIRPSFDCKIEIKVSLVITKHYPSNKYSDYNASFACKNMESAVNLTFKTIPHYRV